MLLAYVRRNCSDSDLSPATAVTHMRVSVRSVHKLTERTEHTFGEWLLDERLHRYVRMFRDPAQVRRKISDIAWLLGYREASAFTHAFHRWFGKTPSEMRFKENLMPKKQKNSIPGKRRAVGCGQLRLNGIARLWIMRAKNIGGLSF